jgi:hypothetical protein
VWPYKYLGMPLGLCKATAAQLQPVVDSAEQAPALMRQATNSWGQTILVQKTLSAISVHSMMSLDIPLGYYPRLFRYLESSFICLRKRCVMYGWSCALYPPLFGRISHRSSFYQERVEGYEYGFTSIHSYIRSVFIPTLDTPPGRRQDRGHYSRESLPPRLPK